MISVMSVAGSVGNPEENVIWNTGGAEISVSVIMNPKSSTSMASSTRTPFFVEHDDNEAIVG